MRAMCHICLINSVDQNTRRKINGNKLKYQSQDKISKKIMTPLN